jgi:hypothetical protein
MKFTDGEKRAGMFKNNIYKQEIETIQMLEEAMKECSQTEFPPKFIEELE